MQEGPRRLSWGRTNSRRIQQGSAAVDSDGLAGPHQQPGCDDQCPGPGSPATTPHVLQQDIQPWQQVSPNSAQPAMSCSTQSRISDGILIQQSSTDVQQQVQRGVLRAVLAALLQEDGPQLDHYQLTVQAVAAVAHHKVTEAVSRAREEERSVLTAEHKQQLAAVRVDAEDKANKLVQEACGKASAAAAQHSQVVASLQAQLSVLQREKRQLHGRSAQQSRDARQVAVTTAELQAQLEQVGQQIQKLSKQLEAKEAALTRCKQAHQQELAVIKASKEQVAVAAAQRQEQHARQVAQLQQQHQCQLLKLQQELEVQTQQHQQAAHQAQQYAQCSKQVMHQLTVGLQKQLPELHQQQEEMFQQSLTLSHDALAAQQLRDQYTEVQVLRSECAACRQLVQQLSTLVQINMATLQNLQHQVAAVAPDGLEVLQQQLTSVKMEQQAAGSQLQETLQQLALAQAAQNTLQQEKHRLQEELKAAQTNIACLSKELKEHQEHVQQQAHQLRELHTEVEAVTSALSAAEALLSDERIARAAAEDNCNQQLAQQQQEVNHLKQQLAEASSSREEQLQQLLQHASSLCSAFFSTSASDGSDSSTLGPHCCGSNTAGTLGVLSTESVATSGGANRTAAMPLLATAVARLAQYPCIEESVLEARYQQFLQHKQMLLHGSTADTSTWRSVCNQTLQLEAGLLQMALGLQDVLRLLQQHETSLQRQLLSRTDGLRLPQRPSTASSRCSDTLSADAGSSSSGSSGMKEGHGDLAKQLLQALVKEKKQLTAQLRRLQRQRSIQHVYTSEAPLLWQRSDLAAAGVPNTPATAEDAVPELTSASEADAGPTDDLDEVLLLLKGCQLNHVCNTSKGRTLGLDRNCHLADTQFQDVAGVADPSSSAVQVQQQHVTNSRHRRDLAGTVDGVNREVSSHGLRMACSSNCKSPQGRGIASLVTGMRR